jgi:hypothetical protein
MGNQNNAMSTIETDDEELKLLVSTLKDLERKRKCLTNSFAHLPG